MNRFSRQVGITAAFLALLQAGSVGAQPPTFVAPVRGAACAQGTNEADKDNCGFNCICDATSDKQVHTGIDFDAAAGDPVVAPFAGIVKHAGWHTKYGGVVVVESTDGSMMALIAHLQCDIGCDQTSSCPNIVHNKWATCDALVATGTPLVTNCPSNDLSKCRVGYVGPGMHPVQNGGWKAHVHITLRYGRWDDLQVTPSSPSWPFPGYVAKPDQLCEFADPVPAFASVCETHESCDTTEQCHLADVGPWSYGYPDNSTTPTIVEDSPWSWSSLTNDGLSASACPTSGPGAWVTACTSSSVGNRRKSCAGVQLNVPAAAASTKIASKYGSLPTSAQWFPCDNGGSAAVHDVYGVFLQDFCYELECPSDTPSRAIIYNPTQKNASVVRDGFWYTYKCLSYGGHAVGGATLLGAPLGDETVAYFAGGSVGAKQLFERGYMTWDTTKLRVHVDPNKAPSDFDAQKNAVKASALQNCGIDFDWNAPDAPVCSAAAPLPTVAQNPSFSDDPLLCGWQLLDYSASGGNVVNIWSPQQGPNADGTYLLAAQSAAEDWTAELAQLVSVSDGTPLRACLSAKANASRTVTMVLQQHASPYQPYNLWQSVPLATDFGPEVCATFSIPPGVVDASARFALLFGDSTVPITIDRFSLEQVGEDMTSSSSSTSSGGGGCVDQDGDGFCSSAFGGDDCADADQTVHPGVAEICNSVDDDCDGQIDEGNICAPPPPMEICDGVDNNGNGQVDEGNPGGGGSCAVPGALGACSVGTQTCQGGLLKCIPNFAAVVEGSVYANCGDGVDNDCNGQTDCQDVLCGPAQNCAPPPPPPPPPGCFPCTAGMMQCWGAGHQLVCNYDPQSQCFYWSQPIPCSPGNVCIGTMCTSPPVSETCNGVDDDADGQIDEGNPGGGVYCSTGLLGACTGGSTICTSGSIACVPDVSPTSELCNGSDDDCNGVIDNGYNLATDSQNCGSCGHACLPIQWCAGGTCLSPEVCNGLDDDGDGQADDGNPGGGGACTTGLPGVCGAGAYLCSAGSFSCQQAVGGSAETCDGVDNDCDGQVDEGCGICQPGTTQGCYAGPPGTLGVGPCTSGLKTCDASGNWPQACVGGVTPVSEVCDGVDNDCDGTPDDGDPGGGIGCNTGLAGVCGQGTKHCLGGALACTQNAQPTSESCNGLDDDCDGAIDDGSPGGGASCVSFLPGACSSGTLVCQGGTPTCQPNAQPVAETCDGVDNDCDGVVDGPNANCPNLHSVVVSFTPTGGDIDGTGMTDLCDGMGWYTQPYSGSWSKSCASVPNGLYRINAEIVPGSAWACGEIQQGQPSANYGTPTATIDGAPAQILMLHDWRMTWGCNFFLCVGGACELCCDGIDNDADGLVDAADSNCSDIVLCDP